MGNTTSLLAGLDVLALEVAAVGDDIDCLDFKDRAGRFDGLHQQAHVHDLVGHRLLDNQLVLGVDRHLHVVADADLRMRGHCAAVGIGQRYLVLAGSFELGQHRVVAAALLAQRRDLLGQVLRARAAARRAILDIALVEPLEIVLQRLVGGADECSQRERVKLRSLLLTALIRVPSTAATRAHRDRAAGTATRTGETPI